ncbi:MAG: NADPH:quinone oxidoreductase family protein [Xanthobacteraceae bacterium]
MKAVLCVRPGPPEALEIADLPDPKPGPGEALCDVKAAGLNLFDLLIISNRYQVKPALPFSPGAEFAGVVMAVGEGVHEVAPGDRVCSYVGYGAAREKIAVLARSLVRISDAISFETAAGLIVTYSTAIHALEDRARIKKGETLAVLGAAGGVGIAAVEVGKILGARVIACASSPEKLAFARERGADASIDYSREDLKERLRELTDGRGADVVLDPVGGPLAEPAVRGTAWEGRYLVVGFAAGEIPKLALNHVLLRGCSVVGVTWGMLARHDPPRMKALADQAMKWAVEGRISAHVDKVYPLARVAEALTAISRREVKGKIILKV